MTNGHPKLLAAVLVTALAVLAAGVAYFFVDASRRVDRNTTALTALCLQRSALDERILSDAKKLERSRAYLRSHPNGAPGIPRLLIVQSIGDDALTLSNDKKTRRNLSILDC